MEELAADFTVFAPDTPGFGLSDPLAAPDAEPDIDMFVDALERFFDTVGLAQPAIYGTHTGAILAIRFAVRYPVRVSALVANGILLMTEAERADQLAQYFVPFVPRWDGSHLAWLWSRLRDQIRFYPWYHRCTEARIDWPMTLDEIAGGVQDMLAAGDNYRAGYRAVLDYEIERDLVRLDVPTRIIMVATDALSIYADRFPKLPPKAELKSVPGFDDVPAAMRDFLLTHAGGVYTDTISAGSLPASILSRFVAAGAVTLHVKSRQSGSLPPVLVLHDIGSSAASVQGLVGAFGGERPIHAPDLPGHGESDTLPGGLSADSIADCLFDYLAVSHVGTCVVTAIGRAASIALKLAENHPDSISELILCNLPPADSAPPPPAALRPDMAGAYLITLWSYLRDFSIAWPWRDLTAGSGLPESPVFLQRRLADWLKSGEPARQLAASVQVTSRLAACACPVRIFADLPHHQRDWPPILLPT
jgi:pimeloyl-ACP methyl ester carboxylesterase